MRRLTKMKLINWHYFTNETVIFDGDTLITGDNSVGKSTLVDALQLAIVANVKKVRFNASAMEDRTTRDLKGYLRGKTGTEGQNSLLRSDDFSSYVVLEITRKDKQYLAGVVFDYYGVTGEEEHVFFMIDEEPLSDDLFFHEPGNPRNRRQFFDYLKARDVKHRTYRNDINRYNYDLRQLFGGVKESFFSLFTKGISFSPITNLRRFVYDYILEEQSIDVETMRVYLEKFRQVELIIEDTKKEIEALEEIENQYKDIEKLRQNLAVNDYMVKRGNWEKELARLRQEESNKAENERKAKALEGELSLTADGKKKLMVGLEDLEKAVAENEVARKEQELGNQISLLRDKLHELEKLENNLTRQFRQEARELNDLTEIISSVEGPVDFSRALIKGKELWEEASEKPLNAFPESWPELAQSWYKVREWLTLQGYERKMEEESLKKDIAALNENIEELKKNQVLGSSSPVMKLKRVLEENLKGSSGEKVAVNLLCELTEIKDRRWQDAVEGYLHTRKFDILVPPDSFEEALFLYEREKLNKGIEGVGLVDTKKLLENWVQPKENSLAGEISAETDYAAAYADFLLGSLIKCENVEELFAHRRGITTSCILYDDYAFRQIPRSFYEVPYIGREAVRFQLERRLAELKDLEGQFTKLAALIEHFKAAGLYTADKKDRYAAWSENIKVLKDKESLSKELNEKHQEFITLDFSELNRLKEEKKLLKGKIGELDKEEKRLSENKGVISGIVGSLIKVIDALRDNVEALERVYLGYTEALDDTLQKDCIAKWDKESAKRDVATLAANYASNREGINTRINNLMVKLVQVRSDFTHEFNFSGDPSLDNNDSFRERYRILTESHLKDYQEKAEDARRQAEQTFQENFVAKLGEYIARAEEDTNELNRALKDMRFGNDTYRFSLTAKSDMRRYYKMITDKRIHSGSIFQSVFFEDHGDAIKDLFAEISRRENELQDTMQDFTDYRSFLDFEIIITDNHGNKKYFSRVSRVQSGGETQVPFYVAILASFYQVYQLYRKQDALPLVVFDEAFNRMDADRIEESITFMKNLGFQAIIVAPTGKIQLIIPHVNTNLIIMREGFNSFIERASRKELLELED